MSVFTDILEGNVTEVPPLACLILCVCVCFIILLDCLVARMWKLWMQCNRTHNNDWVRTVANHISLCIHVLVTLIVNFSENRPNIYCMVMRMILLCITRKWETVMCNILCMCDGLVFLWFIMIFIFFLSDASCR